MFQVALKPQWQLSSGNSPPISPRLIELLAGIDEEKSLASACRKLQLSYRYAWGLLREAERQFGLPLLHSRRGQGARLSALGERLVWAERRISARLTPLFDSLSSELEIEIEHALSKVHGALRLHASHGFAVEALRKRFHEEQIPLDLKYCTSVEAVTALSHGACEMAGFHVPVGGFEDAMLNAYLAGLERADIRLILLATRRQGLMSASGNPLGLTHVGDLNQSGIRFVNRQPGSGTRLLIDLMLDRDGVDRDRLEGYDLHEFTHAAVAAYIASGMADAGIGVETPARRFGLSFLPLVSERYFFACRTETLATESMQTILTELASPTFRARINALAGYDAMTSGTVMRLSQAFPGRFPEGPTDRFKQPTQSVQPP